MANTLRLIWHNGDTEQTVELTAGAGKCIGFNSAGVPAVLDIPETGPAGTPGFEPLAADPAEPVAGQTWFDTVNKLFRGFDGDDLVTFDTTADA